MDFSVVIPISGMSGDVSHLRKLLEHPKSHDLEVIVVHDIADEETSESLKQLKYELDYFSIYEGFFGCPGLARNFGFEKASREWITFWDADDDPLIEEFIRMVTLARSAGAKVAIGNYQTLNEITLRREHISHNANFPNLYLNVGLWRMCFRREILLNSSFSDLRMAEDQIFFASLKLKPADIFFHNQEVYLYYYGSSSHLTQNHKAILDLRRASKITFDMLLKDPNNSNLIAMFLKQRISLIKRIDFFSIIQVIIETLKYLFLLKSSFTVTKSAVHILWNSKK